MRLSFGDCVFDSDTREVFRAGRSVPTSPKAFALLDLLIERHPKAVSKAEIHARLWPDTFVSEANLANDIIKDPEGRIAELLDARRTPEAYLLDSSGTLRYHGRIASKLSAPDLQLAIEALLEGKPIRPAETKAFGCAIARR